MGKTRGVHETTPEIRNRMVGMYEAGLTLRDIATAVNCSQRTVKRWLNRFDKEGNVDTRDRCGRKRATTHEQDEAIVNLATQTSIKAAKAVLPALGLKCSVDTIRERLHKAGIHNWNPSKKLIEKIPLTAKDGVKIQQPVWRSTGTKFGKKKLIKEAEKVKKNKSPPKKKTIPKKTKPKQVLNDDKSLSQDVEQTKVQQNPSFSSSLPNEQIETQISEPNLQLPPEPPHPMINCDQIQYIHSLNLMPQPQPTYHHHPGLNVSQNWSIELTQTHYIQNQNHHMHHNSLNIHPELYNPHQSQLTHHVHNQLNSSMQIQHHNSTPQKVNSFQMEPEPNQELTELSPEKLNESQDIIINVCSDACSNSSTSFNENSQNSSTAGKSKRGSIFKMNKKKKTEKVKKKKGGKVKGTLETSVEIRNRMVGMSESGLSTYSIALAINRSERTVKRWLNRWQKEGNVETKERKGRKRITTKEQDEAIIAMATQHPLTAAKHVAPALGLKCSVDTIRERLHTAGIHSWKLGKKEGEGNTVHSVHLWQPSGNRSNKVKINDVKKKKSFNKKQTQNPSNSSKQNSKKYDVKTLCKSSKSSTNLIPKETNVHFPDPPQASTMIQSTHSLSVNTPTTPVDSQQTYVHQVCSQSSVLPQSLQTMTPVIPQRPECRLAVSSITSQNPNQSTTNITYPSCMMVNSNHPGHIEQTDPMNFEPFIWSF